MNRLPDFIIIGAGKCGTTSLYNYLNQHPQLSLCSQKETYFFIPEPTRSKFIPWGAVTSLEEYKTLFKNAPKHSIIGEISTTYYRHTETAQLIYDALPQVKIIAILRDPAERAFSDYQMHFRNGNEKQNFSKLIYPDNRFIKPGYYYSELIPYFHIFARDRLKIILFDDLQQNPLILIRDLFDFLEVDTQFIPDISKKSREGGLPKNQTLNLLLTKKNPLRTSVASVLRLFMPFYFRQEIRSSLIKQNIQKTKLSTQDRSKLIELYKTDILHLEKLIDRDLSSWLKS
ncbi:sulfotransferase [Pleurocapsales cyanobacterium LEGE 06147]|nr:sulfotransferase [Pleurocapsales cyanobacterium LEGE 06147]